MNIYKILSICLISLLILSKQGFSQNTQGDTLILNKKQVIQILKDKRELKYRRELNLQDSLLIQELEQQIKLGKGIESNQKLLIDSKDKTIQRLRFQNRLIIIGASTISGLLLYQAIK